MRTPARIATPLRLIGLVLVITMARAAAQDGVCRLVDSDSGPPRQILRCPAGPTVEAEARADVRVRNDQEGRRPVGASIGAGAALFDVPPGYPGGFQILTPRAIASVRGTMWVVDVQAAQTSVFVLRGEVAVQRPDEGRTVTLGPGDGVDVRDDGQSLAVTPWAPARVAALLARFGR